MDYTIMIDQERAKIELLRAKQALLATQIADSEHFISVLEKRAGQDGDALDKFLEGQLATKSAPPTQPVVTVTGTAISEAVADIEIYEFPKVRSDSIWPFVVRFMTSKQVWKVDEIIAFAKNGSLVETESAIRSTLSALKTWGFVENDTPGYFALKPKGFAYAKTLKPNQFILGGAAGTPHSENNV